MKELLTRFYLNGSTIGLRPKSQKLEPPNFTLEVEGLILLPALLLWAPASLAFFICKVLIIISNFVYFFPFSPISCHLGDLASHPLSACFPYTSHSFFSQFPAPCNPTPVTQSLEHLNCVGLVLGWVCAWDLNVCVFLSNSVFPHLVIICLLYWNSIVLSTQYFVIVLKVLSL